MTSSQETNNELCGGSEFRRLSKFFHSLTGKSARMFSFPGLQNRYRNGSGSALANTKDDAKVVLTYRVNENLAELEAEVLGRLYKENAPVPKLLVREKNGLFKSTFMVLD